MRAAICFENFTEACQDFRHCLTSEYLAFTYSWEDSLFTNMMSLMYVVLSEVKLKSDNQMCLIISNIWMVPVHAFLQNQNNKISIMMK